MTAAVFAATAETLRMRTWFPSVDEHLGFGAIALLTYVINTRIQGTRRPPTSAISWAAGLLFILPPENSNHVHCSH